jgi:hypothetical protein
MCVLHYVKIRLLASGVFEGISQGRERLAGQRFLPRSLPIARAVEVWNGSFLKF